MDDSSHNVQPLISPGHAFAGQTFDAVLFDLDGTLINSIPVTERCWGQWMVHYGYAPEHYHQFHGTPARAIVAQLLPPELREEGFRRILELELSQTDGIVLLPGVPEALASIPSERRAIVTSSTRDLASLRTSITGIDMPVIVCADDVARGKPFPEPYLLGAERLGVDPHRCVVFEDAPSGLRSGALAGARTVAVPATHELATLQADAYVSGLNLIEFLWDEDQGVIRIADRH